MGKHRRKGEMEAPRLARKIPVAHDTSLPVDQTDQKGWGRQGMRIRFYLVGLGMAALATALGQPAEEAADPNKGVGGSEWVLDFVPRGYTGPPAPDRFLVEVYDPEVGWRTFVNDLFPDATQLSPQPGRPRQNDPLFFRFTDFELDLSFTGYTAWDQPDGRFFTYPVNEEWREKLSIVTSALNGCNDDNLFGCNIYSTYAVADSLVGPSYYIPRFLEGESIPSFSNLEFLPDNTMFPRQDWRRDLTILGSPAGFSFRDPLLVSCSPAPGQECGMIPRGGVIHTFGIDGYTSPTFVDSLEHCMATRLDLLLSPVSVESLSPSDLPPPNFPFPAPDQFITWAVEDMLIAKGDPVGLLKRSIETRGPLFTTASLSAEPVGETNSSDVSWPFPTMSATAGTTVTLPLVIAGGIDHTAALSMALRIESPVPLSIENVTAAASPQIDATTFRDRLRVIDDHTLEYRCLVTGDFSTADNTTIATITIVLPPGLQPGDQIDLVPLVEPINNVLPTSLVDVENRPVINPACGEGPCQVQSSPGRINIVEKIEGADMWILLGDSVE